MLASGPLAMPLPTVPGATKTAFAVTPALVIKAFTAFTLGVLALYLLNTGRRENSPEKLFWAALAALASFFVFF